MEWMNKIKKLFSSNNISQISSTHSTTINIYKIHTLNGDTYWVPEDETYRQLGPVIRHSYAGAMLNKDIKIATIIPWHQIDWLKEAGEITI